VAPPAYKGCLASAFYGSDIGPPRLGEALLRNAFSPSLPIGKRRSVLRSEINSQSSGNSRRVTSKLGTNALALD
jgi:hypothetical protein